MLVARLSDWFLPKFERWVHGRNHHKGAGIGERGADPGDGHLVILQRLAQAFHRLTGEFRQLVQEQDAVVASETSPG